MSYLQIGLVKHVQAVTTRHLEFAWCCQWAVASATLLAGIAKNYVNHNPVLVEIRIFSEVALQSATATRGLKRFYTVDLFRPLVG